MTPLDMSGSSSASSAPVLGTGALNGSAAAARPISALIRQRLQAAGVPFLANDNVADYLRDGELELLEREVTERVRDLLRSLLIDIDNDHNTEETPERVARMYLHEVFKGRYHPQPKIEIGRAHV